MTRDQSGDGHGADRCGHARVLADIKTFEEVEIADAQN